MWKRILDYVLRLFRKPGITVSRGQVVSLEAGVFDHVSLRGGVLRWTDKAVVKQFDNDGEGRVDFQ
jgi:hypothetical protein